MNRARRKARFSNCCDCVVKTYIHKIFKIGFTGTSHKRIILTMQVELAANLEMGKNAMRKLGRTSLIILTLLTAGLMLAGCRRRGALERLEAAQTETVTVEMQQIEQQAAMPAPETGTQAQPTATAAPTATPKSSASSTTSGTDWDALMNDLDDTLDALDDSIYSADQDALTDTALIALGK